MYVFVGGAFRYESIAQEQIEPILSEVRHLVGDITLLPLDPTSARPSEEDLFLYFQPRQRDSEMAYECCKLFPRRNSFLVDYENPIAYPYHYWQFRDDFAGCFAKIFSSAANFCDNKQFHWIPVWNFVSGLVDENLTRNLLPAPRSKDEFLVVNPLRSGLHVSKERLAIIKEVLAHIPCAHIYGQREVYEKFPFSDWQAAYQGPLEYSPEPYRFLAKIPVYSRYGFTLCVENAFVDGYISEKLGEPLAALSIPIYFGYPHVEQYLPRLFNHGVIEGHRYQSIAELCDHVGAMSEEERGERIQNIAQSRIEYFELTSKRHIWRYLISKIFNFPDICRSQVITNHNVRLATINESAQRQHVRSEIIKLIGDRSLDGEAYSMQARALLAIK